MFDCGPRPRAPGTGHRHRPPALPAPRIDSAPVRQPVRDCQTDLVQAPAAAGSELSSLPARRPRWLRHVVAAGFVVLDLAIVLAVHELARRLALPEEPWFVAETVDLLASGLPGVLLLPAYRRVGFRQRDVLFFLLLPFWGFVIAWKVGFRLTALPYRDWPPRPDEDARTQIVPSTPFHVVLPAGDPGHHNESSAGR